MDFEELCRLHSQDLEKMKEKFMKVMKTVKLCYGNDREKFEEIVNDFMRELNMSLERLVQIEEDKKLYYITTIERLCEESVTLSKELNTELDIDFPEETPLKHLMNKLEEKLQRLRQIKSERMEEFERLKHKETELCRLLNMIVTPGPSGLPSSEQLAQLRSCVDVLETSKIELNDKINNLREQVCQIMNELQISPFLSIELFCFDDSHNMLPYSQDTFLELQRLVEKYETQKMTMMEEAESLRNRLSELWSRIREPYETRENILSHCLGYTKEEIAMLKNEVKRCQEIKQKKIKEYIKSVKEELEDWWSKCLLSEDEKHTCFAFYQTHISEDVLVILEMEACKMRDFYLKYEKIFHNIETRKQLWDRMVALEELAKDCDRFNNRGGSLLKEEKERKKITKDLPKIEEKLKLQVINYETEEGKPFTIYGERVLDVIEKTWNEWYSKKDEEKNARRVAGFSSARATSVQQHGRNNNTPGIKRKFPQKNEIATGYKKPTQKQSRPVATPSTLSSHDFPAGGFVTPSDASVSSSYSLFQEHLERNEIHKKHSLPCRSSLSPTNVLKPHNGQLPSHSSPKTPRLTPYYRTPRNNTVNKTKTPLHKSPFRVCTASSSKIPTLTLPVKSASAQTKQKQTPRRRLPIII
ncbi:protein regulator of cytokinesis 1-like [Lycorma delicatula]|uniref:protein regulator of cytokinesis 1-like n=1 Tax=Lycorma delicatula TaxID=130591 RepID=UPI003F51702F